MRLVSFVPEMFMKYECMELRFQTLPSKVSCSFTEVLVKVNGHILCGLLRQFVERHIILLQFVFLCQRTSREKCYRDVCTDGWLSVFKIQFSGYLLLEQHSEVLL